MATKPAKTAARKITSSRVRMYREADKHPSVVVGPVDKWLQLQPNDRDATVIHPSEMSKSDWCDRATWHRLMGHQVQESPANLRASLIFDTGHSIHDKWQSWFRGMGVLWGRWACRVCHGSCFAWSDELVGACPSRNDDGLHLWEYKEVPLRSEPKVNVAGHADGIVNPSGSEPLLLEIKSVGPGTLRSLNISSESDEDYHTKFSRISHVSPSHLIQVQIYLHLMASSGYSIDPVRRAVVVYENKADQQIREFLVDYDPKWAEPLMDRARDIMWSLEKGREVPCPHSGCPQCRKYEAV